MRGRARSKICVAGHGQRARLTTKSTNDAALERHCPCSCFSCGLWFPSSGAPTITPLTGEGSERPLIRQLSLTPFPPGGRRDSSRQAGVSFESKAALAVPTGRGRGRSRGGGGGLGRARGGARPARRAAAAAGRRIAGRGARARRAGRRGAGRRRARRRRAGVGRGGVGRGRVVAGRRPTSRDAKRRDAAPRLPSPKQTRVHVGSPLQSNRPQRPSYPGRAVHARSHLSLWERCFSRRRPGCGGRLGRRGFRAEADTGVGSVAEGLGGRAAAAAQPRALAAASPCGRCPSRSPGCRSPAAARPAGGRC